MLLLHLALSLALLLTPVASARTHGPRRLVRHDHVRRYDQVAAPMGQRLIKKRATPVDDAPAVEPSVLREKRLVGDVRRSRTLARRTLNDPPIGTLVHVPLRRAPPSDAPPLQRFYAHQAHALVRHARAVGQPVDVAALRKRAMPIGMAGKQWKPVKSKGSKTGKGAANVNVAAAVDTKAAGFSKTAAAAAQDDTVTQPVAPKTKNTLGLAIEGADVGYFANVQIGTPPKTFKILMDSGSADFWVPSQACSNCGPQTVLGSKTSSTFQASNQTFAVTYGTGEVDGAIIKDDVTIGTLKLTGHIFGAATSESVEFSGAPFDGLMGLAQSILSEQGVPTPIESLASQGLTSASQVGYKLARVADGAAQQDSQITFGGVDNTKFTGSLALFDNISKQGFWEVAMGDVTVDGKSLKIPAGRSAILDTGTTLIVAPAADATAVHAAIPGAKSDGQGGFTIPCTSTATVALVFGGKSFAINPVDLAFLPVDLNDLRGQCVSGISAGTIGGAGQWLVGDVFLKNNYFAHDVANNQIGLAPAK